MHDQRASKTDALAHAAGQLARISEYSRQPNQIDRRQRALANLGLRQAERLEAELHVFQHREPGKQRKTLKHHGDARRRSKHRLTQIGDEPSDGCASPAMSRSKVDLPEPVRPVGRRSGLA